MNKAMLPARFLPAKQVDLEALRIDRINEHAYLHSPQTKNEFGRFMQSDVYGTD